MNEKAFNVLRTIVAMAEELEAESLYSSEAVGAASVARIAQKAAYDVLFPSSPKRLEGCGKEELWQYEVRCGNHFEMYVTLSEAFSEGTSATVVIDHKERKVYVPEVIENTFRGEFNYSPEATGRIFAQEIDWAKMRRQMEDRLRKDKTALRYVCAGLGVGIVFEA